jgi:hypothetical protein
MPVRLVMPAARSSAMMGARSAAARLARTFRASRLARLKNAGFDMRVLPSGCTGRINSRSWRRQR